MDTHKSVNPVDTQTGEHCVLLKKLGDFQKSVRNVQIFLFEALKASGDKGLL